MPSRWWRPQLIGPVKKFARSGAVAVMAVASGLALSTTPAAASVPVSSTDPPLESLVLSQPLPGYTVAPPGPTNGPMTATEFASQSTAPQQAEEQFNSLAAQPSFGAFIRLWTDRSGPGQGANDMAALLFRIPKHGEAATFAVGLRAPFAGASGTDPFDVPSIPGAHGYSVHIAAPVRAVEQIVIFRAGRYVSMTELASSASTSNPAALSPSQAIAVSFQQYEALRHGDPSGSVDAVRPARPVVPADTAGGTSLATVVVLIAALLIVGAGVVLVFGRVRRRRPVPSALDPWAPGGIFDTFGATTPTDAEWPVHVLGVPELDPEARPPARMVPALVSAPSYGSTAVDEEPFPGFD